MRACCTPASRSPFWAGDVCLNEPDGDCTYVFDDTTEAGTLLCGDEAPPVGDDRPPRDVSYGDDCEGGAACITDPDELLMCEAEYDRRHGWYVYCPEAESIRPRRTEAVRRVADRRESSGWVLGAAEPTVDSGSRPH
jgi:hypothetical protein